MIRVGRPRRHITLWICLSNNADREYLSIISDPYVVELSISGPPSQPWPTAFFSVQHWPRRTAEHPSDRPCHGRSRCGEVRFCWVDSTITIIWSSFCDEKHSETNDPFGTGARAMGWILTNHCCMLMENIGEIAVKRSKQSVSEHFRFVSAIWAACSPRDLRWVWGIYAILNYWKRYDRGCDITSGLSCI